MGYNEGLMNEALQGSKSSKKELESNAGAGSAEAQYYLALYYAKANGGEHDSNYHYWMQKAQANGYRVVTEKPTLEDESEVAISGKDIGEKQDFQDISDETTESKFSYDIWFLMGFEGRIGRSLYCFVTLVYTFLTFTLSGVIREMSEDSTSSGLIVFVLCILSLVLWMFWIAQAVKRAHDLNCSGWWILIPFVPLWLLFAKGSSEENDYGEAPMR